jgi:glycosyltransferase involved in cell wall biosynthesis
MATRPRQLNVAIVGIFPPPIGGISVHIQRLHERLDKYGIAHTVYDVWPVDTVASDVIPVRNFKYWALKHFFGSEETVIHCHLIRWRRRFLLVVIGLLLGKKTVLTYHSLRREAHQQSLSERLISRFAARFASHSIAVGPAVRDELFAMGARPEKTSVIPAYLPPVLRKEDIDAVPRSVWDFADAHSPVISANAFHINFYRGQDLYGLDMCVDLCAALKGDYPELGFLFALPYVGEGVCYLEKIQQLIDEKGIRSSFMFITESCPFYPILMRSDVFVRPTNTDGDAISVREALQFGKPVVASDASFRPNGVVVFRSRDIEEFVSRVRECLQGIALGRLDSVSSGDTYFEDIVRVYEKMMS